MKTEIRPGARRTCPTCHHALVPVHAVSGALRTVTHLVCPEPYCEYAERLGEPAPALPAPSARQGLREGAA